MTIKEQLEAKNLNTQYFDRKINKENFFRAVKTGDCNKIRLYVNNGIDINSKDEDGWTALMIASENDKKKIVKLLIELGADVKVQDDDEGKTALMHAIYVNSDENAKILLKNGSDINAKDNYGQTPFILAACSNSKTIGELLIDLGADIDAYDDQGKTAFDLGNNDFQNFLRKQEIKEKITKNRIGRINHILKSFSFSKEFGNYIGFKKNYKKLYGYEINTSRLEDCIRDYNSNSYDKILIFDHICPR